MSSIILLHSRTLSKINKRAKVQGNDNLLGSTWGMCVVMQLLKEWAGQKEVMMDGLF